VTAESKKKGGGYELKKGDTLKEKDRKRVLEERDSTAGGGRGGNECLFLQKSLQGFTTEKGLSFTKMKGVLTNHLEWASATVGAGEGALQESFETVTAGEGVGGEGEVPLKTQGRTDCHASRGNI